jgi:hypothetical protein
VPLLLLVLVLPLVLMALMPLILIQRYRAGSARRPARSWIISLNLVLTVVSAVLFLAGAAVTSIWVTRAISGAVAGLLVGLLLGLIGLALTRWEPTHSSLHYTPNRWLVLLVTFAVSGRVLYGLWRSWSVASAGLSGAPVVLAFGIPESLAAGGLVIGYSLAYAAGVRRRLAIWQERAVRVMTIVLAVVLLQA